MQQKKGGFIEIAGTRIKLSNIKQYGVTEYDSSEDSQGQQRTYRLGKYEANKWANPKPKSKGFFSRLFYKEFIYDYEQDLRLYITTFQNDNFSFYKKELREDFDRIVKELDDSLKA